MNLGAFLGISLSFRQMDWTHEILDEELEQGKRHLAFSGSLEPRHDLQDYQGVPIDQLPVTFYVYSRPTDVPRESAIGGFSIIDGDIYAEVVVDHAVYESLRASLADPDMQFQGFNITVFGLPDEETGDVVISFAGNNPIRLFKAVFRPLKLACPAPVTQTPPPSDPLSIRPILNRLNILIAVGAGILLAVLL